MVEGSGTADRVRPQFQNGEDCLKNGSYLALRNGLDVIEVDRTSPWHPV